MQLPSNRTLALLVGGFAAYRWLLAQPRACGGYDRDGKPVTCVRAPNQSGFGEAQVDDGGFMLTARQVERLRAPYPFYSGYVTARADVGEVQEADFSSEYARRFDAERARVRAVIGDAPVTREMIPRIVEQLIYGPGRVVPPSLAWEWEDKRYGHAHLGVVYIRGVRVQAINTSPGGSTSWFDDAVVDVVEGAGEIKDAVVEWAGTIGGKVVTYYKNLGKTYVRIGEQTVHRVEGLIKDSQERTVTTVEKFTEDCTKDLGSAQKCGQILAAL